LATRASKASSSSASAAYAGQSRVCGYRGPARFTQEVLGGGQRGADRDSGLGDPPGQGWVQFAVHGHMRHDVDARGHDLAHPGPG
jgi:hypothetical protein